MSKLLSDDMCNCWVAYFPPGDPDRYGDVRSGENVRFFLANWNSGKSDTITVDGSDYTITDTVMSSEEMVVGGSLYRLPNPTTDTLADVTADHGSMDNASGHRIVSAGYQSDLDDHDDVVYKASL